jgi:hypothetical protein
VEVRVFLCRVYFFIATEVIMINALITNNVIFDLTDVLFIK